MFGEGFAELLADKYLAKLIFLLFHNNFLFFIWFYKVNQFWILTFYISYAYYFISFLGWFLPFWLFIRFSEINTPYDIFHFSIFKWLFLFLFEIILKQLWQRLNLIIFQLIHQCDIWLIYCCKRHLNFGTKINRRLNSCFLSTGREHRSLRTFENTVTFFLDWRHFYKLEIAIGISLPFDGQISFPEIHLNSIIINLRWLLDFYR